MLYYIVSSCIVPIFIEYRHFHFVTSIYLQKLPREISTDITNKKKNNFITTSEAVIIDIKIALDLINFRPFSASCRVHYINLPEAISPSFYEKIKTVKILK